MNNFRRVRERVSIKNNKYGCIKAKEIQILLHQWIKSEAGMKTLLTIAEYFNFIHVIITEADDYMDMKSITNEVFLDHQNLTKMIVSVIFSVNITLVTDYEDQVHSNCSHLFQSHSDAKMSTTSTKSFSIDIQLIFTLIIINEVPSVSRPILRKQSINRILLSVLLYK